MLRVVGGRDAVRVVWLHRCRAARVQLVQRFVVCAARAEQKTVHARAWVRGTKGCKGKNKFDH